MQPGSGYSGHPKLKSTLGHAHHPHTAARLSCRHTTPAQAPRSTPWWRKPPWSTLQIHRRAAEGHRGGWGMLIYPLLQSGSKEESCGAASGHSCAAPVAVARGYPRGEAPGGPRTSRGMDQAISRGPFQPHLFRDSVVSDNTGMFQKALLGALPKYVGSHSLGGWSRASEAQLGEPW